MSYRYTLGGEPDEEGRTSRISIDLAPTPEGTEVTLVHAGLHGEVSEKSHAWGWGGALDKLVLRAGNAGAVVNVESEGRET